MPKDNVYPGSRDVDAYMATAPNAAQPMLRELRQLIREAAPAAKEKLSYGMPFYEHHGHSRLFRGLRDPPRSYDAAHVDSPVVDEAKAYLDNRSTLRFPIGRPLPVAPIWKVIRARVREHEASDSSVRRGPGPKALSQGEMKVKQRVPFVERCRPDRRDHARC